MRATSRTAADSVEGGFKFFFGVGSQDLKFDVGEQNFGRQFWSLSAQESHQHDSPRNDDINPDRPPNALRRVVSDLLDGATGLQDPVPVFNAPTQTVPAQTLNRIFGRSDINGSQQEPLDGIGSFRRSGFNRVNHPDVDGILVRMIFRGRSLIRR